MKRNGYAEPLGAILDLRNATEIGFATMEKWFDKVEARIDKLEYRLDALERFGTRRKLSRRRCAT